jgi:hypothetical protein
MIGLSTLAPLLTMPATEKPSREIAIKKNRHAFAAPGHHHHELFKYAPSALFSGTLRVIANNEEVRVSLLSQLTHAFEHVRRFRITPTKTLILFILFMSLLLSVTHHLFHPLTPSALWLHFSPYHARRNSSRVCPDPTHPDYFQNLASSVGVSASMQRCDPSQHATIDNLPPLHVGWTLASFLSLKQTSWACRPTRPRHAAVLQPQSIFSSQPCEPAASFIHRLCRDYGASQL